MKAFFAKVWNAIKGAFSKMWSWSLGHKAVAIVVAAAVVVGATCAIVLPIALHDHKFAEEWTFDATNHWHASTCKHGDEKGDLAAHVFDNDSDAKCDTCGYERTVARPVDPVAITELDISATYNGTPNFVVNLGSEYGNIDIRVTVDSSDINVGDNKTVTGVSVVTPNTNYVIDASGIESFAVTPYILECPTSFSKTYDGTNLVDSAPIAGVNGEMVVVRLGLLDENYFHIVDAGTHTGSDCVIEGFFVNDVATENYDFSMAWYGSELSLEVTIAPKQIVLNDLYYEYKAPTGYVPDTLYFEVGDAFGIYERDLGEESIKVTLSSRDLYDVGVAYGLDTVTIAPAPGATRNYTYVAAEGAKLRIVFVKALTPANPEPVNPNALATENVGVGYEGGMYKVALSGGRYGITMADYDLAWDGCFYDENGNKYEAQSGNVDLEAGTYYFKITVPNGSLDSDLNFKLMKYRTLSV